MEPTTDQISSFVDFMGTMGYDVLNAWLDDIERASIACLRDPDADWKTTILNRGKLDTLTTLRSNIQSIYIIKET